MSAICRSDLKMVALSAMRSGEFSVLARGVEPYHTLSCRHRRRSKPCTLRATHKKIMISAHAIRLAVDIGGTFTDVAVDPLSGRVTVKVLTTPEAPERAVMESVALATAKAGCLL